MSLNKYGFMLIRCGNWKFSHPALTIEGENYIIDLFTFKKIYRMKVRQEK